MRGKSGMIIGFMAMVAAIGMVHASSSFASELDQVVVEERIGHGGSTYQSKSVQASNCPVKDSVVERIGAGGSTYSSSQTDGCHMAGNERPTVTIMERVGAGGSTYSSSQPVS